MAVLVQHGFGKADKIDAALNRGIVDGVIISPRDENQLHLSSLLARYSSELAQGLFLFDPQIYVSTIGADKIGHLAEYPFYRRTNLANIRRPQRLRDCVSRVIDYQNGLSVSHIVSPSTIVKSFDSQEVELAMRFAEQSILYHQRAGLPQPLLVSLPIAEEAFRSTTLVNDFLNIMTDLNCDGFYLLVSCSHRGSCVSYDSQLLANILYTIYVLSILNEYNLYIGYADIIGLLFQAVGATGTAFGWYENLCKFGTSRFFRSSGRRQARNRFLSIPTLSKLLVVPELREISQAGELENVKSGTGLDDGARFQTIENWSKTQTILHAWEALHNIHTTIERLPSARTRVNNILERIGAALIIYDDLINLGIRFDVKTGPSHLLSWRDALQQFAIRAGL